MIWTRWWYGVGTLLVVISAWMSMYLLYPGLAPDAYELASTSPQSQPLFAHMYAPETATDATQYRWSEPQSSIMWSGLQLGSMAIATVQLADVGAPVTVMVDQYATTITGRRTVMMLLDHTVHWPANNNAYCTGIYCAGRFTRAGDTPAFCWSHHV
ncbi:MAG: hypothetical protein FJ040_11345 [Chloroflexi bacterium]|nr:hypothetical protein [Chloroflexota bacterium]